MSRFSSDCLDAQEVLADIRLGNFVFSLEEYKIAFDEKISREDLAELEAKFFLEGYIYENVQIWKIGKSLPNSHAFFVYPMKKKVKN